MAKKQQADFSDIQDVQATGPGFASVPMPSQAEIDRVAATTPQIEPEQMLPGASARTTASVVRAERSVHEIVQQFFADIQSHPDCKLLTSAIGGKPGPQVQFEGTPLVNQHMAEIRLVYRDPANAVMGQPEKQPSAFEPGGKYYDLIPRRDTSKDAATATANETVTV